MPIQLYLQLRIITQTLGENLRHLLSIVMELFEDISIKPYNSFGIQAQSQWLVNIKSFLELKHFLESEWNHYSRKLILGGGSNVLFTRDYRGLILRPIIKGIEIVEENEKDVYVRAMCGENWDEFVAFCLEREWYGLENLSLIPGNVGACPIQNIGAYGKEVKDAIFSVEAIYLSTFETVSLSNAECEFGYRSSIFKTKQKDKYIIYAVVFKLSKIKELNTDYVDVQRELENYEIIDIKAVRSAISAIRWRKLPDPNCIGNAGSFFKNPIISLENYNLNKEKYPSIPGFPCGIDEVKVSAAWLIEQISYKGVRKGDVGTSPVQPLVIVNYGDATGQEILNFAQEIQSEVMDVFGICLEIEVNVI